MYDSNNQYPPAPPTPPLSPAGDDFKLTKDVIRRIKPAYPIIVSLVYLIAGFAFNLWNPGWMLFLTIPIFFIVTRDLN
ncbi:MAG: hypothetical protein LBQ68_01900 [Clostridiales bacterium]|nr:hypothetical protein [Clostridiales bacterium]